MTYFQKQLTPEHQWVVFDDHDLNGYVSDKDDNGDIKLYTEEEAEAEVKLYKDFNVQMKIKDHYQENYRGFQNGDSIRTEGKTPKQKI